MSESPTGKGQDEDKLLPSKEIRSTEEIKSFAEDNKKETEVRRSISLPESINTFKPPSKEGSLSSSSYENIEEGDFVKNDELAEQQDDFKQNIGFKQKFKFSSNFLYNKCKKHVLSASVELKKKAAAVKSSSTYASLKENASLVKSSINEVIADKKKQYEERKHKSRFNGLAEDPSVYREVPAIPLQSQSSQDSLTEDILMEQKRLLDSPSWIQ